LCNTLKVAIVSSHDRQAVSIVVSRYDVNTNQVFNR